MHTILLAAVGWQVTAMICNVCNCKTLCECKDLTYKKQAKCRLVTPTWQVAAEMAPSTSLAVPAGQACRHA